MRKASFPCFLCTLALTVATTAVHADDTGGSVAPTGTASSAGGCPCDNDPCTAISKACDCCGPGTNPWDGTLKVGAGIRTSFNYINSNVGGVSNTYNYFNPDDMRIYASGTAFGGVVKGTLNTEVTGGGNFVEPDNVTQLELLDGICQFEFSDMLNVWTGRFLPPTDRANLDGPYYQTPYDYPFVSNYPSLLAGRDDGAAYWGQAGGGKLKWQVGAFNGIGRDYDASGNNLGPNYNGDLFYIARVTINLLDPEPGYYTQSCYFGEKEILAIGLTYAGQKDGAGTSVDPTSFDAESVDVMWEHKFGNCGVVDFEGAYYNYNYGGVASVARTENQGNAEYYQLAYLMPADICVVKVSGKLQPFVRYQQYNRDFKAAAGAYSSTGDPLFDEGLDIGVNYVISGYNARATVAWGQRDLEGGGNMSLVRTGVQLQF